MVLRDAALVPSDIPETGPDGVLLRPMRLEDVDAAEKLSAVAFADLRSDDDLRTPERAEAWRVRTAHLVERDGPGCWVAEDDGEVVGMATSLRRDSLWVLATFAVRADWQSRGLGRLLLDAAGTYSRGALRAMLSSTSDPKAVRRYRSAGFDLHPQMVLGGVVRPDDLTPPTRVRDGEARDTEWMDSLDRGLRGAARGSDHDMLRETHRLRVVDQRHRRGYAYLAPDSSVELLAASDRRTASELMSDALLGAAGRSVRQAHVSAANQWALDVGLAAGLSIRTEGYLCLRGLKPPTPYIHHSALL